MEVYRISSRLFLLLGIFCLVTTLQDVQGGVESEGPSESECRPYIEKALKELETAEAAEPIAPGDSGGESKEEEEATEEVEDEVSTIETTTDDSVHTETDGDNTDNDNEAQASKESTESIDDAKEEADDDHSEEETGEETSSERPKITSAETETEDAIDEDRSVEDHETESEDHDESNESTQSVEVEEITTSEEHSTEKKEEEGSDGTDDKRESAETGVSTEDKVADGESADDNKSVEIVQESIEVDDKQEVQSEENENKPQRDEPKTEEDQTEFSQAKAKSAAGTEQKTSEEEEESRSAERTEQKSAKGTEQESTETAEQEPAEETGQESAEEQGIAEVASTEDDPSAEDDKSVDEADPSVSAEEEQSAEDAETYIVDESGTGATEDGDSQETATDAEEVGETETEEHDKLGGADDNDGSEGTDVKEDDQVQGESEASEETVSESDGVKETEKVEERPQKDESQSEQEIKGEEGEAGGEVDLEVGLEEMAGEDEDTTEEKEEKEFTPEEELINEGEIPEDLRPTDHIWQLLKLDDDNLASEKIVNGVAEITLRDLKKLYENAIKPLETLYKYRDLSNRHFGDAEIFSKPLVLFMGPWSGGKSSIINYLLNNEYNETSLRTGAEPSPAYFNILMYGEEPEVLDGTQLAADFTFSGLQKFGQGLEERLRGLKLPQKLLQKINIVEIPGILEVRKQVSRVFPFNDACQWFIDRADIIYLVYDPSKLDVGPETEAILDQLKGREHQTRMILNKADQVKPEELMRVQGALIWNISPLMSSAQPPVMYTTSLWSKPYELGAPIRLLQAQERAFLRDLRSAVDKRIENKIASARRFAVRVRNHAKMVDCYLTTYYNHKSVFGNRKQVSDAIIEHPQDYHIYEGLSTLTNISRYDLPDPDVYRDFFRLNPLYDFQQLSATCTYFRGCPINRLDVAIAYDLPELIGKHKRMIDTALTQANLSQTPGS